MPSEQKSTSRLTRTYMMSLSLKQVCVQVHNEARRKPCRALLMDESRAPNSVNNSWAATCTHRSISSEIGFLPCWSMKSLYQPLKGTK